jgi:hypothetical protein
MRPRFSIALVALLVVALSVLVGFVGSPHSRFDWELAKALRHGAWNDTARARHRLARLLDPQRGPGNAGTRRTDGRGIGLRAPNSMKRPLR